MTYVRAFAVMFGFSVVALAGTHAFSSTPVAASAAASSTTGDERCEVSQPGGDAINDDGTAMSCGGDGDECDTKNAGECCRGLRCVGSVCKQ